MRKITVGTAKSHRSHQIKASLAGEDVTISRAQTSVVRPVPVQDQPFQIGLLAEQVNAIPDFLAPMNEDELDLWEGGVVGHCSAGHARGGSEV